MEKLIIDAYHEKDWKLISQFLLNKQQMIQLQYALGSEDFLIFVSTFQVLSFKRLQAVQLEGNKIYCFISGGFLMKKQQKAKQQPRLKKMVSRRQAMKMSQNKLMLNVQRTIPKGFVTQIQSTLTGDNKPLGYYYNNQQESIVLRTSQQNIPIKIVSKIKHYFSEKLKFISRLNVFSETPKNIIQQNIDKFKFLKICFSQIIYSRNIRPSLIFILVKGQAMIGSGKSSIILRPPNIFGDQKLNKDQQSHCLTQYCILYAIQRNQIEAIFKKQAQIQEKQYKGISNTTNGFLRTNFLRDCENRNSVCENYDLNRSQITSQNECPNSLYALGTKNRCRKIQTIGFQKRNRIKQHFSNFLNEKFQNYESKISQNILENEQKPILFQMKPMLPSIPNYDQINNRLKQIRLKRILEQKQRQQRRSNSIHSILMQTQQQEKDRKDDLDDRIRAKIMKTLDLKIARQMNRRYKNRIKIL